VFDHRWGIQVIHSSGRAPAICGAESGGVPVSAVSPGIFISQIESQKKSKSQDRIPVLPAPFEGGK